MKWFILIVVGAAIGISLNLMPTILAMILGVLFAIGYGFKEQEATTGDPY